MRRVLILVLIVAITSVAVARDKKPKSKPGPYVFTIKASAQTVKDVIVQASLNDGYALDTDHQLQFRFSRPAQMPLYGSLFMASSACPEIATKQVWSYTLVELNGATKVTVQPAWEYPDDYCEKQTHDVPWSQPEELVAFQAMLDRAPASVGQTATPTRTATAPTVTLVSPTTGAHQPQDERVEPATQPQVVAQDEATLRAKQHQACLDLAKDNPSITCK